MAVVGRRSCVAVVGAPGSLRQGLRLAHGGHAWPSWRGGHAWLSWGRWAVFDRVFVSPRNALHRSRRSCVAIVGRRSCVAGLPEDRAPHPSQSVRGPPWRFEAEAELPPGDYADPLERRRMGGGHAAP